MSTDDSASTLRERKQRATRERLLAVARALFAERGYERTTMDDIAAGADVSRATAFNYFPRKEELLLAWVAHRGALIAELLAREESESIDVAERLSHALMKLCDVLEEDAPANQALARAWVQAGGPLLPGAFATADVFAETLRHAQSRGQLRSDIDPDRAGRVLLDTYQFALIRWAGDSDNTTAPLRDQLDAALDIILNGLRTR